MKEKPVRQSRYRDLFLRRINVGAPPGVLPAGRADVPTRIDIVGYGPDELREKHLESVEELPSLRERYPVLWVNATGLGDSDTLRRLAAMFDIHPLILEDIATLGQRPKTEFQQNQVFVVARMLTMAENRLDGEQLSVIFGNGFVLTFQERPGDCLDTVRERLRKGLGRIRNAGADYLAYALVDAVVDHYFPLLEECGEQIQAMEDRVMADPAPERVAAIHRMKHDLLAFSRAVWPLREALTVLEREEIETVQPETRRYIRDCYEHVIQVMDMLETYRELASGLMDMYLSSASNRMNEVMRVLTVFASIFIPLTFIAGIYGMNFDPEASPWNMPELDWAYGYPACLGLMALTAIALLVFFARKGWLGKD